MVHVSYSRAFMGAGFTSKTGLIISPDNGQTESSETEARDKQFNIPRELIFVMFYFAR
jgi:hypothetical protein